jgi:hypothetical protein
MRALPLPSERTFDLAKLQATSRLFRLGGESPVAKIFFNFGYEVWTRGPKTTEGAAEAESRPTSGPTPRCLAHLKGSALFLRSGGAWLRIEGDA